MGIVNPGIFPERDIVVRVYLSSWEKKHIVWVIWRLKVEHKDKKTYNFLDWNIKIVYLAIHSVSNSPMSRNTITEILQIWEHTASLFMLDQNGWYLRSSILEKQLHTFILKALLKPLAKKPPKGAIIEANKPRHKACHWTGRIDTSFQGNCIEQHVASYIFRCSKNLDWQLMITE